MRCITSLKQHQMLFSNVFSLCVRKSLSCIMANCNSKEQFLWPIGTLSSIISDVRKFRKAEFGGFGDNFTFILKVRFICGDRFCHLSASFDESIHAIKM